MQKIKFPNDSLLIYSYQMVSAITYTKHAAIESFGQSYSIPINHNMQSSNE